MKRNNVLLRDYKAKKMAKGGLTKPFVSDTMGAIQAGGTIADGLIDGIDPIDEYGVRSGLGAGSSGAIKGAMAGAALGPAGIAGGAVLGAVTSLIGNKKAEEAKQQSLTTTVNANVKRRTAAVDTRLANDPTLLGDPNAQMKYGGTVAGKPAKKFSLRSGMVRSAGQAPDLLPTIAISPGKMNKFALGGPVDDKDPKKKSITTKRGNVITDEDLVKIEKNSQVKWGSKEEYGDWLDKFAAPVPENKPSVSYKFGKRGESMTQDEWDFVRTKRKYPDVYAGGESDTDNRITGDSFSNEVRNDLKEYRTKKMKDGGPIKSSVQDNTKVVTPKLIKEPKAKLVGGPGFDKFKADNARNLSSVKAMEDLILENGNPGIDTLKNPGSYPKEYKGHYTAKTNTISIKGSERAGDVILQELAHAKQYQTRNKVSIGIQKFFNDRKYKGEEKYKTPGTFENDAHSVISTELEKDYNEKKYTRGKSRLNQIMAKGGVIATSSRTAEVVGPKHKDGGVKLPSQGIEVEGGESMSKDFVFSDQLGIASIHNQIGKAMGKNEKKPDTALNLNTQKALVRKEGFLKIYQEQVKKDQGLPNEIDNTIKGIKTANKTSNVVMAKGGPIKQLPRLKESKLDITGNPGSLLPDNSIQLDEVGITAPRIKPNQLGTIVTEQVPSVSMTPMKANVPPIPTLREGSGFKVGEVVGEVVGKAKTVLNDIAPFASNIANAFRRLPAPPQPIMDDEITPSLINLSSDRAEAVRQRRGADKGAAESLNSNNAVVASKAANLTGQIRATNDINQTEQNANAQIKNQAQQINANIKRGNNLKQDFYNNQKVERQLKQQSLDSENIADVGNKLQAINRDKAAAALDDDKMLLTIAADDTGATIRAGDAILKRRLSSDGYKQMVALGEQLSTAAAEDRAALMAQAKVILDTARTNTDTIVADAKAQQNNEKSQLNQAKVRKLQDSYKQTRK